MTALFGCVTGEVVPRAGACKASFTFPLQRPAGSAVGRLGAPKGRLRVARRSARGRSLLLFQPPNCVLWRQDAGPLQADLIWSWRLTRSR